MALRLITAPTIEPVTLDQTKSHLRVDHTYDDVLITSYIEGARIFAEKFTGRAFITQTWELTLDAFPANLIATNVLVPIEIPLPPLQSITSVNYNDANGNPQTMPPTDYRVDVSSQPGRIWPVSTAGWPNAQLNNFNVATIRFVAGYSPSADSPPDLTANVPESIKNAILLQIGQFYAQREGDVIATIINKVPTGGILHLLRQYRVVFGMS